MLAYRQRRLDVAADDVSQIKVARGKDEYVFERRTAPGTSRSPWPPRRTRRRPIARPRPARLEATEFIAAEPKEEELDKTYGLAQPELRRW